jgi:hypothetical protein
VLRITTSLKGDHGWQVIARDWYQPSTGAWTTTSPIDHTSSGYNGTEYWQASPGTLHVTRGQKAYVAAVAAGAFDDALGAYLYKASTLHLSGEWARIIPTPKVTHDGDRTVLTAGWGYATDSGSGVIPMKAVAVPTATSGVVSRGAFAAPAGTPTWIDDESRPAAAAEFAVPRFWLGPSWDGRTARATVQTRGHATLVGDEPKGPSPTTAYDTTYAPAATPTTGVSSRPGGGPTFVGLSLLGPSASGVTTVETSSLALKDALIDSEPPGSPQPITLADGEHATLTSWTAYGTTSLAMVTTRTVRIVLRGIEPSGDRPGSGGDPCFMVQMASALRPVGYHGPITHEVPTGDACTAPSPPTDNPRPAAFPQPGNPPPGTRQFGIAGARRPKALANCTTTPTDQVVAELEKALACTVPFRGEPASCATLTTARAEADYVTFVAADLAPFGSCRLRRGEVLFASSPSGWTPVFLAAHPICGGWKQVAILDLQRLFPGYWEEYGPKSREYECPG